MRIGTLSIAGLALAVAACASGADEPAQQDPGAIAGVPTGAVAPVDPAGAPGAPVAAPQTPGAPATPEPAAGVPAAPAPGVPGTPAVPPAPAAAACASLPNVQGHPNCEFQYPTYPGFTLALVEEFEAPLDLVNDPVWTYSDGALDEGGIRFIKEGVSFENGSMKITIQPGDRFQEFSFAEQKFVTAKSLTSGELRTKYNNYRYGRYEVALKTPSVVPGDTQANGGYVSTLFVFRTPKFQLWREIDIEATGDSPTALTTNVIHGENRASWAADFALPENAVLDFNHREDFHVYAFEWTSDAVRWFVDGVQVREFTSKEGQVQVPTESAKIMMNLWLGAFGGNPANNTYPLSSEYDWFRFYKWDQEPSYPMDPALLPATDLDGSKNNLEDGLPHIESPCEPGACTGAE